MKFYSEITHLEYDPSKMIYLIGERQCGLYIANGCTVYDILWSRGRLVFVFDRKESKAYYDKWCKYELPDKDSTNAIRKNELNA